MSKKILLLTMISLIFYGSVQAYIAGYSLWEHNGKRILILDDIHADDKAYGNESVMESILQLNTLDLAVQHWIQHKTRVDIIVEYGTNNLSTITNTCYRGMIHEFIKMVMKYPSHTSIRVMCADYRQMSKEMYRLAEILIWFQELVDYETIQNKSLYNEYKNQFNRIKKYNLKMSDILNYISQHYNSIAEKLSDLSDMQPKLKNIKTIINELAIHINEPLEEIVGLACLAPLKDKKRAIEQCGSSRREDLVWQRKMPTEKFVTPLQVIKYLCDIMTFTGDFSFISRTYQYLQTSDSSIILVLCGLSHAKALKEFMRGIGARRIKQFIAKDYSVPLAPEKVDAIFEKLK